MALADTKLSPSDGATKTWRLGPLDKFDLLLLFLTIVMYAAVASLPFSAQKLGDKDFHIEAINFATFLRGGSDWHTLALTRAPLPSLWYTIPYLLRPIGSTDNQYWQLGFLWTTMWMAVALLLIRRTAERLGGPLAGKLSGLLVLASPFAVYYSYAITGDPVAYIATAVLLHGWVCWRDDDKAGTPRKWPARMATFGAVMLVLSRPNAGLLAIIAIGVGLLYLRKRTPEGKRQAAFAFRIGASIFIALCAMIAAGKSLPGRAKDARQSGYLAHTVFQGRFQFRNEPFDWRFWGQEQRPDSRDFADWDKIHQEFKAREEATGIQRGGWQMDWFLADVKANFFMTFRQAAVRLLYGQVTLVNSLKPDTFHMGPLRGKTGYILLHVVINFVNILMLVAAVWALWARRGSWLELWPMWGTYLALLLFHILTYMEPRYLFPARVVVVQLGAIALAGPAQRLLARFRRPEAVTGSSQIA